MAGFVFVVTMIVICIYVICGAPYPGGSGVNLKAFVVMHCQLGFYFLYDFNYDGDNNQ